MKKQNVIIHKSLQDAEVFVAGDKTLLSEILHPDNDLINLPYSMAHARILAGNASVPHVLKSTETYFFLEGKGTMQIGEKEILIQKGDLVVVPPLENQYVTNSGSEDLVFLCIVSPKWKAEDEIIFDKK